MMMVGERERESWVVGGGGKCCARPDPHEMLLLNASVAD